MKLTGYLLSFLGVILSSCDSGDIYPEEPVYENTRTLNIHYTLSGVETIPDVDIEEDKLKLMFIVHNIDGTTQSKTIYSGVEDSEQIASITYVPYEVERVDLSIVGTSKSDVIHTFNSISVPDGEDGETELDLQFNSEDSPIELVSFERIESQLFAISCCGCHGSDGRSPYLDGSNVYKNIVNVASPHGLNMDIITPQDVENSSMYYILNSVVTEITFDHSALAKTNDKELLKSWIEADAPKN